MTAKSRYLGRNHEMRRDGEIWTDAARSDMNPLLADFGVKAGHIAWVPGRKTRGVNNSTTGAAQVARGLTQTLNAWITKAFSPIPK